jgi:hypothetical protein
MCDSRLRKGCLTLSSLQVCREERHGQLCLGVVEERLLFGRRDLVDGAESETQETVRVPVPRKRGRDLRRDLDCLAGYCDGPDRDHVRVHETRRSAAVAVADAPFLAFQLLCGRAGFDVVDGLVCDLCLGGLTAEHPQVGRSRVKVEVERLWRCPYLYGSEILRVEGLGNRRSLSCTVLDCLIWQTRLGGWPTLSSLGGAVAVCSSAILAGGRDAKPVEDFQDDLEQVIWDLYTVLCVCLGERPGSPSASLKVGIRRLVDSEGCAAKHGYFKRSQGLRLQSWGRSHQAG